MSHPSVQRRTIVATVTDEIGIEIGVYGDWRLRAELTPVYSSVGSRLQAVAVKGRVSASLYGRPCDMRLFQRAVAPRDRPIVASLAVALCLRNLQNTFVEGLKVIVAADSALSTRSTLIRAAVRALARELDMVGLAPSDVVVDLTQLGTAGTGVLYDAAVALRSRRIRFGLAESGEGIALQAALPPPDLVVIGEKWFESISGLPATTQLFRALVQGYRARGSIVLIEGVRTAAGFRLALEAGAEWLCGDLLSAEAPAGAVFAEETLPIETLLDERRVIKLAR